MLRIFSMPIDINPAPLVRFGIVVFCFFLLCFGVRAEGEFGIITVEGTRFLDGNEPFYFIGANQFQAVMQEMEDFHTGNKGPDSTEYLFEKARENGIKVIRIIMYNLDDAKLEDPVSPPSAVLETGGNLEAGEYVYCYTAANASRHRFKTDLAQTLPSPSVKISTAGNRRKVRLTIPSVKYAYRYLIYRRQASQPQGSEKLLSVISVRVGESAEFMDDGSYQLKEEALPAVNTTQDNPKTRWPGEHSGPFQTGPGNWNEDKFRALDRVIEMAGKYKIRLILVLSDQHENNTGGVPEYCRMAGDIRKSGFFTDPWVKAKFKEWIEKIVTRVNSVSGVPYKEDAVIFAWELINEPYATGGGNALRSWAGEMAGYIKSLDTNHLVGLGDDGSVWFDENPYFNYYSSFNVNNNHDFVAMGNVSRIDFLTWHGYPQMKDFLFNWGSYDPLRAGKVTGPLNFEQLKREFQRRADYAVVLNKPVVIGEWGLNWKEKESISAWIDNSLEYMINTHAREILGRNLLSDASDLESAEDSPEVFYSRVIDIEPNGDYWVNIIFKNHSPEKAYLIISGRESKRGKWRELIRIVMGSGDYWDTANFISRGFLKLNAAGNAQFKVNIEGKNKGGIYLKNAELRQFVKNSLEEKQPVFGGICFWNWGMNDFDPSNKQAMNSITSFIGEHKDLFLKNAHEYDRKTEMSPVRE